MTRILLLTIAIAACTPSSSSIGKGTLTVTWKLLNIDGSTAGCQPGYDKMVITTNAFGSGDPQAALFDCAAGMGVIDLPGGTGDNTTYIMGWAETNSTGGTVLMADANSQLGQPVLVDLASGAATVGATLYPKAGWIWTEWALHGTQVDAALDSCAGAGVDHVEVTITDVATSAVQTVMAACDQVAPDLSLETGTALGSILLPAAPGDYTLTAKAFASGVVVGESAFTGNDTVTVQAPNEVQTIPSFVVLDLTTR